MWKQKANIVYNSFEKIQEYQNSIASNEKNAKLEQNWVDKNLIPLIDIMGTDMMWQSITQNDDIKISGLDVRKSTRILEKKPAEHNIEANFSGNRESGGHWYSRKKGEYRFFDAYEEFQINGTNLWCQTFALMYVCGRLPRIFPNSITKYYYYNYNYFKCKSCGKSLTSPCNLRKHIKIIHIVHKDYKCDFCGKSFN